MENNKIDNNIIPYKISGHHAYLQLQSMFIPKVDLTYRIIEKIKISGINIRQSLLTGTLLRNDVFIKSNMSRCDLEGMRIENSRFIHVDFSVADIRSCIASKTIFVNCNFEEAYIDDCQFTNCVFINCSFMNSSMTGLKTNHSSFINCRMTQATILLNQYISTKFSSTSLGDCTFLFHIFSKCRFENIKLNVDSLGAIYGITNEDILRMKFIYLGSEQKIEQNENIVSAVLEEFKLRKWHFKSAVMKLNLNLISPYSAIEEVIASFKLFISKGLIIQQDNISFLNSILEELYNEKRLPFFGVIAIVDFLKCRLSELDTQTQYDRKLNSSFKMLFNNIFFLMKNMLSHLDQLRLPNCEKLDNDVNVNACITFEKEPALDFELLMFTIAEVSGFPVVYKTKVLRVEYGSIKKWISTSLFSIISLQLFLFGINGCLIQITEIKARWGVLTDEKLPQSYFDVALAPKQELPAHLQKSLKKLYSHSTVLEWLKEPSQNGLAKDNIRDIRIDNKKVK